MPTPINYVQTLREIILETLVPETDDVVGHVSDDPNLQEIGWWVTIGGRLAFFGSTFKAAIFTARQGDWFVPNRDGTLTPLLIEWLETRASISEWQEKETQENKNSRRERVTLNTELTSAEALFSTPYHPELDTGTPISQQEVDQSSAHPSYENLQ